MEVQVSSALLQWLWVQQTWVLHKPSWRRSPLPYHRTTRNYTGLGKHTLRGDKQNLCAPGPRRKEQWPHKRLIQTCPWVSRSLQQRHGSVVACFKVRGTECSSGCRDLLKEVTIIFITSTIVWPQVKQQEGNSPTHQQQIGWKIYWTWPHPSEQDPVSPTVSISHQEASISLLYLSFRGQTGWKLQSKKTNQTNHMDQSLV